MIKQDTIFVATKENCKNSGYLLKENKKSIISSVPHDSHVQLRQIVSINVFEIETILLGFQLEKIKLAGWEVIVYTYSTIAFGSFVS